MSSKKKIIIAGAGFGGITAAIKLSRQLGKFLNDYEIVLINKRAHHLYTPALYEIASIPQEEASATSLKSAVMININNIVAGRRVTFLCDEITGVDKEKKELTLLRNGPLVYEYLVLALGSETNYFDIPGLREYAHPLKTFEDAIRLRNTIEGKFAENGHVRVVVGGAGSSGIELAAEFINFICTLRRNGEQKNVCSVEFVLIEASPEILPGFRQKIIDTAKKRLAELGIILKTNTKITSVAKNEVALDNGSREPFDVLIWTGGVKGPALASTLGFPLSGKESFMVDEYLRVEGGHERIFAIGDNASFINPRTGKQLAWNVPVAEGEGRLVAKNLNRLLQGKPLKKFVPWRQYPFVLAVGKKYAIADLVYVSFSGVLGWILKQLIEFRYLLFILPPGKAISHWLLSVRTYTAND